MRSHISVAHLLVMAVLLLAAFAAVLCGSGQAQAAVADPPVRAGTALLTATSAFSATMAVVPAATSVVVGDSLEVSLSIAVAPPCSYATLELHLRQSGDVPLFDYVSPPTEKASAPIGYPFTFVLRAARPGTVVFAGQAYGEYNCGYWQWWYINGESAPVQVTDSVPRYYIHLPTLLAGWPQLPPAGR